MRITRTSLITGVERSMEIPITQDHIDRWESGTPIDEAMSHLSPSEREFILSGITDEEWDKHVANEEERHERELIEKYSHLSGQHCSAQVCERDRNFILGPNHEPHPSDRKSDHGTIHATTPEPTPPKPKAPNPKPRSNKEERPNKDL